MSMIHVLDKGYVRLLDHMGDDLMVVNAARASFDTESKWDSGMDFTQQETAFVQEPVVDGFTGNTLYLFKRLKKSDERLINFLARDGHFSPFTHPQMHMEFHIPGMVLDQLIKHRIGISHSDDEAYQAYQNSGDNQLSFRYKEPKDFYVPGSDEWRGAPENKKQGSEGRVSEQIGKVYREGIINHIDESVYLYQRALSQGIAPEQARLFLPYYAMYTNRRWTSSLYGIINLLKLRLPEDAQYEIREYANAVRTLVEPLFPYTFRAFGITDGERNPPDNHPD